MWVTSSHDYFHIKWAQNDWEIEQARHLRRQVFCQEQGLFDEHDTDAIDRNAQVLVAVQQLAGNPDQVVGTVRIHETSPGIWQGSRLAVEHASRRQLVLGSGLIKLAVSSANTLGCKEFHAIVQAQNESLFQRLHWQTTGQRQVQGVAHVAMQADLDFYPPLLKPHNGFWIEGRKRKTVLDLPSLESTPSLMPKTAGMEGGLWN